MVISERKKEKILITGENGSLARYLKDTLKDYDITTLTTDKSKINNLDIFFWDISNKIIDPKAIKNCKHIIHLSGFSITKRWTNRNKKLMYDSRIGGAKLILKYCKDLNVSIDTFISASASGYYGMNAKGIQKESSNPGNDWIAKMCIEWENVAEEFQGISQRIIKLRISLLMDKYSGFLEVIRKSLRFGIAPVFGKGDQNMHWIHIKDAANFIKYSIENTKISGPFNLANPNKITNLELIQISKEAISPNSILIKIPRLFLRLILGEKSRLLLASYNLSMDKIIKSNFQFEFSRFRDILK